VDSLPRKLHEKLIAKSRALWSIVRSYVGGYVKCVVRKSFKLGFK
jgi:hypothetical protein